MQIKYVFACGYEYKKEVPDNAQKEYGVRYDNQQPIEIHVPRGVNESFLRYCLDALHPINGSIHFVEE